MTVTIDRAEIACIGPVPSRPRHTPAEVLAAAVAFLHRRAGAPPPADLARMILAFLPTPEPIERAAWVTCALGDPAVTTLSLWHAELALVHPLEELARKKPETIMVSRMCSLDMRDSLLRAATHVFVVSALHRATDDAERCFSREHAGALARNARSSSAPPVA